MTRARLRDSGITIGHFPTGPHNAITDVPGILVGHRTLIYDEPRVARTGVTIVVPREGRIRENFVFAGYHAFNGCGEMTGLLWVEESGLLGSPIAVTNTSQVGLVRDAISQYGVEYYAGAAYWLPVAGETYDGWLNDASAAHITKAHVYEALQSATGGPVAEGNVGGGTGMICHDFKGGIGTSSRRVDTPNGQFTLGALVQANHGWRHSLRVDGVPVGLEIGPDKVPSPWEAPPALGSIIIILATDAPLIPTQCKRLARRATVGLARTGGWGGNTSGDLFLAFATGNHISFGTEASHDIKMLPNMQMNPLFEATADAVEEAILNALTAAQTMTGFKGRTAYALPLDELQRVLAKYGRVPS
jgi:D-aminopeptidase